MATALADASAAESGTDETRPGRGKGKRGDSLLGWLVNAVPCVARARATSATAGSVVGSIAPQSVSRDTATTGPGRK